MSTEFLASGEFLLGCNYWATNAGTAMWRDWNPAVVEEDLRKLAGAGIRALRVFPLWPDFQPIWLLRQGMGTPMEYRFGEEPLPDDRLGRAGLDAEAIRKFTVLCNLAQQYGMKLIVSLLTGWMSGRLFVPPALEGLNVLTDPAAIKWELRFGRCFVGLFREHPAIAAWELGNECNCMAKVPSSEAAWAWTAAIAAEVKAADPTRPFLSGMNDLSMDGLWKIEDQAELTDMLAAHSYPLFTPHCDLDPINTMRSCLHATAETLFCRGIGGAPCFEEELGTLGRMFASNEIAADYLRTVLFSLWAHNCRGLFWWCAADQLHLDKTPYDWHAVERELGLFRSDGSAKPVAAEIEKFSHFLAAFPHEKLPERIVDGVCLLTAQQDDWGVAFQTFLLAKQAGLEIEFQNTAQPIRDANLYLMPSVHGTSFISRRRMNELIARVHSGATLYISSDGGVMSPFEEVTGLKALYRQRKTAPTMVHLPSPCGEDILEIPMEYQSAIQAAGADVLATDERGMPVFTVFRLGKGMVFYLNAPLEASLIDKPGAYQGSGFPPYWAVYRHLAENLNSDRVITREETNLGITEHRLSESSRLVVAVNYSPEELESELKVTDGWSISRSLYGEAPSFSAIGFILKVRSNDAAVFEIQKK